MSPLLVFTVIVIVFDTVTSVPAVDFVNDLALDIDAWSVSLFGLFDSTQIQQFFKRINVPIKYQKKLSNSYKEPLSTQIDLKIVFPDTNRTQETLMTLKRIFNQRMRNDTNPWLLIDFELQDLQDINLGLDFDDDFFMASPTASDNTNWNVSVAYRISQTFPITSYPFGTWSSLTGLQKMPESKWFSRKDLKGMHFQVQSLVSSKYVEEMIPLTNGTFAFKGIFPDIFFTLQRMFNFTFTLRKPPDGNWGTKLANGSWNGMIQQLKDRHADIAVTDLSITYLRSQAVSFGHTIFRNSKQFFVQNPDETFNVRAYIEPLNSDTWLAIFVLCMGLPPILHLTIHIGLFDRSTGYFSVLKSFTVMPKNLTLYGGISSPSKLTSRLAFYSACLGPVLVYYHWESMLISYLATRVTKLPFINLKGLLDNTDFKIHTYPDSNLEDLFKFSDDPLRKLAYETRIKDYLEEYRGHRTIDYLMANEKATVYSSYKVMSYTKEYADCKIIAIPGKYDHTSITFGFQKDSPFLGLFNYYIREMEETGSLVAIFDNYASLIQVCPNKSGEALGYNSCFSAFLVLLIGVGIGLVLMLAEGFLIKFKPIQDCHLDKSIGLSIKIAPKTPGVEAAEPYGRSSFYISNLLQIILTL